MDVPGCVRKVTIAPPIARFPIVLVHGLHEDKVSFDCHGGSKIAAAPTAVLRRIHLYATRSIKLGFNSQDRGNLDKIKIRVIGKSKTKKHYQSPFLRAWNCEPTYYEGMLSLVSRV